MGLLRFGVSYHTISGRFGMFHSGPLLVGFPLHPSLLCLLLCILFHEEEYTES